MSISDTNNIYHRAARLKLRFASPKGLLTVEDLWDLPLTGANSLDGIALNLHRLQKSKADEPTSFVTPVEAVQNVDSLAFEIVMDVLKIKMAERDAKAAEKERKAKRDRIL